MALDKISQTVQQFREDVMSRGGPQIASMYKVTLAHVDQNPIVCYPLSVVIPGRQFVFYEHDLWGTARKIPYKRGYTQCHMSFVVYQDWAERTYLEAWMNTIVRNDQSEAAASNIGTALSVAPERLQDEVSSNQALSNAIDTGGPIGSSAYFGQYEDFIDYISGYGTITIEFLNAQNKERTNRAILLKEAFPAAISQMSMAADGTAYPTFNVTFQFNTYLYL
jgi:hypothetical protein